MSMNMGHTQRYADLEKSPVRTPPRRSLRSVKSDGHLEGAGSMGGAAIRLRGSMGGVQGETKVRVASLSPPNMRRRRASDEKWAGRGAPLWSTGNDGDSGSGSGSGSGGGGAGLWGMVKEGVHDGTDDTDDTSDGSVGRRRRRGGGRKGGKGGEGSGMTLKGVIGELRRLIPHAPFPRQSGKKGAPNNNSAPLVSTSFGTPPRPGGQQQQQQQQHPRQQQRSPDDVTSDIIDDDTPQRSVTGTSATTAHLKAGAEAETLRCDAAMWARVGAKYLSPSQRRGGGAQRGARGGAKSPPLPFDLNGEMDSPSNTEEVLVGGARVSALLMSLTSGLNGGAGGGLRDPHWRREGPQGGSPERIGREGSAFVALETLREATMQPRGQSAPMLIQPRAGPLCGAGRGEEDEGGVGVGVSAGRGVQVGSFGSEPGDSRVDKQGHMLAVGAMRGQGGGLDAGASDIDGLADKLSILLHSEYGRNDARLICDFLVDQSTVLDFEATYRALHSSAHNDQHGASLISFANSAGVVCVCVWVCGCVGVLTSFLSFTDISPSNPTPSCPPPCSCFSGVPGT